MREAARIITGCTRSTPVHALLAEAGLTPVADRRTILAARFLAKARALPVEDPLRQVAEAAAPTRLRSVTGWRQVGLEAWSAAGIMAPIEPVTPVHAAPWTEAASVVFDLEAGRPLPPGAPTALRRREAELLGVPPPGGHLGLDGRLGDWRSPGRRRRRPHRVARRRRAGDQRPSRRSLLELPGGTAGPPRGPGAPARQPCTHIITNSRLHGLPGGPQRAQKRARGAAHAAEQSYVGRSRESGRAWGSTDPPPVGTLPLRPPR